MQAASDTRARQRLALPVQLLHLHQTGHLVLGDVQALAPPLVKADVSWREEGRHKVGLQSLSAGIQRETWWHYETAAAPFEPRLK